MGPWSWSLFEALMHIQCLDKIEELHLPFEHGGEVVSPVEGLLLSCQNTFTYKRLVGGAGGRTWVDTWRVQHVQALQHARLGRGALEPGHGVGYYHLSTVLLTLSGMFLQTASAE